MEVELVYWRDTSHARHTALVAKGRKWLSVMAMDGGPLTVRQVSLRERRFMTPVLTGQQVETVKRYGKTRIELVGGDPYSLRRAAWHFRNYGEAHGTTKKAKAFLRLLKRQNPRRSKAHDTQD